MASTKKAKKLTTAQSTLKAFRQNLNKLLNDLQTNADGEAVDEVKAFNKYLQAEEQLVAKSVDFGGPSPNFNYPTWAGSTNSNGSKSYKKAFKKIIEHVLFIQTAGQVESQIKEEKVTETLSNTFGYIYDQNSPNLSGKEGTAASQKYATWIMDSIIASNATLNTLGQIKIGDFLANLAYQAASAGGPPLNSGGIPPEKFATSVSTGADGKTTSVKDWLSTSIQAYYKNTDNRTTKVNVDELANKILTQLKTSLSKYTLNNEESIKQWVETTINGLPPTIHITNVQKDEIIGQLEQQVSKMFPQPDENFFYSNLQEILLQNMFQPTKPNANLPKVKVPSKLSGIVINTNSKTDGQGILQAIISGGKKPYNYQWNNTTDNSIVTPTDNPSKLITADSSKTYKLIVTDKSRISIPFEKDNLKVFNSDLGITAKVTPQTVHGLNNGQIVLTISGGTNPYTLSLKDSTGTEFLPKMPTIPIAEGKTLPDNVTVKSVTSGGYTVTIKNLDSGDYLAVVSDSETTKATANINAKVLEPQYSVKNGISAALNRYIKQGTYTTKQIINGLEHALEQIITTSITYTFNNLPKFGAQGQLLSGTYDYQLVSRVSDYTAAMINNLDSDYDNFIPENSKNALSAAKEITSAAVAFRNFAISLDDLSDAFNTEGNHNSTSSKGQSYGKISNLINNNSNSLEKIASNVYNAEPGKHGPYIKTAELNAVQLASTSAGLSTSLKKLLTKEQSTALTALSKMKDNASSNFQNVYKDYMSKAKDYFSQLDDYIKANQTFNLEMVKLENYQNAIAQVGNSIEAGTKELESNS